MTRLRNKNLFTSTHWQTTDAGGGDRCILDWREKGADSAEGTVIGIWVPSSYLHMFVRGGMMAFPDKSGNNDLVPVNHERGEGRGDSDSNSPV